MEWNESDGGCDLSNTVPLSTNTVPLSTNTSAVHTVNRIPYYVEALGVSMPSSFPIVQVWKNYAHTYHYKY